MKILIAISSCEKFEYNHQSMRDTWLAEATSLGMDYRFFLERDANTKPDAVVTDSDDWGMTDRLKAKLKWALSRDYDYVFSCFPDTYARPDRMLRCGFDKYDYFGCVYKHPGPSSTPYCQGGAGYLVSHEVMDIVSKEPFSYLNDDCWLGDVLHGKKIRRGHSVDFRQWDGSPLKDNTIITSHLSHASNSLGVPYTAKFMYDEHQKWLDSGGTLEVNVPALKGRSLRWERRR